MTYTTEIVYNRLNHDYDMLLNGEYIGSRPDYYGTCEECIERAEPEHCTNCGSTHMVAPAGKAVCLVCGKPWTAAEPAPGIDPALRSDALRSTLVCPSCDAPTHDVGMCKACRVEATSALYGDELMMPQAIELAIAGPAERFIRAPGHDRRISRGDDFSGDAWQDRRTDEVRWTAVGHSPNGKIGGSEADPDLALAVAGAG